VRDAFGRYLEAFPDLKLAVEDTFVQGNRAVQLWNAQGTHSGRFMNIPSTGRTVTVRGVSILTIENSKIKRALHLWDVAEFLRAVRLLPEL
jgi:steroid delta-isomerase-like uncharacterized protein